MEGMERGEREKALLWAIDFYSLPQVGTSISLLES